ncbi:unnamed protein product [Trichogramma brassicae]|uniref:t-SNARE coiled-coil homology domain-containing protein n=1 Tax=Trichogramma brassicae TaxID=86971 RepID=A0A6H5I4U9_9HYME|nr:unnamed protein product [Trichogramma brassicae]
MDSDIEAGHRHILMESRAAVERGNQSVAKSQAILGEQRETLMRAKNRLINTDQELAKSRKIINTMKRRVLTNKFVLILIIIFEVVILGLTVYIKFFKK